MWFSEIRKLVESEQDRREGKFIEGVSLEEYFFKIKSNAEFFVHYSGSKCVGFVAFYCNDPKKEIAFISLVLISPEHRGQRVAESLMGCVFAVLKARGFKSCQLEVRTSNFSALALYRRIGFSVFLEKKSTVMMEKHV